jgi:hypothetical protein
MTAILSASVRRTIVGLMPLASEHKLALFVRPRPVNKRLSESELVLLTSPFAGS